jgi:HD superfamily phosphohydrolase
VYRRKIINDPVYGFVTIPSDVILRIIDHPWFQRLRNIRQLGFTHYVYPGALHTRFHHALGAMHLMSLALEVLRAKGHEISPSESEAAIIAILLHDTGHGPFSHALENVFIPEAGHETLTKAIMSKLNQAFDGRLEMAMSIFENSYPKPFLHQLVSSQLDVDRLDYLNRDSFFAGVSEGVIGYDRIIKMLEVHEGNLVVEQKGIYSIEKFLVARRLMFWQVYLHRTVLVTEMMIRNIFRRAIELLGGGHPVLNGLGSKALTGLLTYRRGVEDGLDDFLEIDDHDVMMALKTWQNAEDRALSELSSGLLHRRLLRLEWIAAPMPDAELSQMQAEFASSRDLTAQDAAYFVFSGSTVNHAYRMDSGRIGILFRDGTYRDITEASDLPNIIALAEPVVKFYLCRPK